MNEPKATFYFIPHTHWEGAVFKTREQYLEMGLPNILRALKLLTQYPNYRFALDQTCYVEPFLQRYPEEASAFRRFVAEGRLALVGGTDVMLDVNMPGGESFVRQVLYGKGYFRRTLGVDVTVGWQLDTFGHHAQMPQLLRLAGYTSFWFFRGVANWSVPADFLWQGLDGTRIPAFWLPHGYANLHGSPRTLPEFTAFVRERYEALAPVARGLDRIGLSGADVCEPEEHVPALVAQFNALPGQPFRLQLALPAEVAAARAQRPDLPVVSGELNPIFQGAYSSRIELKQRTRELETLLTAAEKTGAILQGLGTDCDDAILWRAWEPMLFNQAHDLMSGVMTDGVYEDTIRGYDFARRIAVDELQARRQAILARIDTQGAGIPLVVSNSLGWTRTDIAITTVGFGQPGVHNVELTGPDGQAVACQILDVQRHADGALAQAKVAFLASDVPALGHAVYHLRPTRTTAALPAAAVADAPVVLENEFYHLTLNALTGAIEQLTVKDGNWQALRAPANVVTMEEDHGDFWEPYRPLDGGSRIAMTERHAPPQPGQAVFSTEQTESPGTVTRGPVFSEFTVAHPFSRQGRFQTTIRLYAGVRRIEISTKILNQDSAVRYRVLFPLALVQGRAVHEIPFGASERPDGIEFPAQNWADWSTDARGVALLNRGLPGNNVDGGTMMLSLLRSTRIVAYGFGGGYEPGMGSDSGLQLGHERCFDYSLVPHAGNWQQAAIYRDGHEFNQPLLASTAGSHPGVLPPRWGFLDIPHRGVVLSALKTGVNGGAVLRVYEAAGIATGEVPIRLPPQVTRVEELNLVEDPIASLVFTDGVLRLKLRPFEIKTIGLHFAP